MNGHFSDGTVRDITPLTAFDSSDEGIGMISASGVVPCRTRRSHCAGSISGQGVNDSDHVPDQSPGLPVAESSGKTKVDQLVFAKLKQLQIQPSNSAAIPTSFAARHAGSDRSIAKS